MSPFVKETLTGLFCIALLVGWVVIHITHETKKYDEKWNKWR